MEIRRVKDCYKGDLDDFLFTIKNNPLKEEVIKVCNMGNYPQNPIIILGESGSGKTHLANCIVNEMRQSDKKAIRVTTEELTYDIINMIRSYHGSGNIIEKYRKYDLLVIDEMEGINGRFSTISEIARICQYLHKFNVQVIFMCCTTDGRHQSIYDELIVQIPIVRAFKLSSLDRIHRVILVRRIMKKSSLVISVPGMCRICRRENMGSIVGMLNSLLAATSSERKNGKLHVGHKRLKEILGECYFK